MLLNEMVSSGAAFFDGEGIGLSHTILNFEDMPHCSGKIRLLKWKFALVFFFGLARHRGTFDFLNDDHNRETTFGYVYNGNLL